MPPCRTTFASAAGSVVTLVAAAMTALTIVTCWSSPTDALPSGAAFASGHRCCSSRTGRSSSTTKAMAEDDFTSFAATLQEDANQQQQQRTTLTSPRGTSKATEFQPNDTQRWGDASSFTSKTTTTTTTTWQADLERFLDPSTSPSQRQILASDLLNANADIRASVQAAIRDRTIDPLLTPTGKKLQDGTRAVARQLTSDILPSLTRPIAAGTTSTSSSSTSSTLPFLPPLPSPQEFSRVSSRLLNAVSNQLQRNLETLQSDIANPSRIPERIAKQTEDFLLEAGNVFAEKPAGLKEPAYRVVSECVDYEIRDYEDYTVVSTTMDATNNPADQGVAFNTLASYIFGANADSRSLEMTTPVTTTASGEMRFFVPDETPPEPLAQDTSLTPYSTSGGSGSSGSTIRIERIPATRLAVRRFTGFCTAGEVARQKQALLAALALDEYRGIELDVPHGQAVGHVVFQYNPPYTLPVLRLNEIAVPVAVVPLEGDESPVVDPTWEANVNGVTP